MGLKQSSYAAVAALGDLRAEAVRFMRVISGIDHPACIDLVCANAGALLYIAGQAPDLPSGVSAGKKLINSGRAFKKLCQWITVQCDDQGIGLRRFTDIAAQAGLKNDTVAYLG